MMKFWSFGTCLCLELQIKVTAAIMSSGGKLFIARRPPGDKLAGKWEFPGGKIKNGETPEACLAREMKEEFDIDVEVGESLGSSVYHYPDISVELLAYRTGFVSGIITMKAHEALWGTIILTRKGVAV
jgi:8-oxo-dGTP diphosphatase